MSEEVARIGVTPTHAGEFIREEILAELDLSLVRAAEILGCKSATKWDPTQI
jgi:plasmid maintenance system antidote protein VapI